MGSNYRQTFHPRIKVGNSIKLPKDWTNDETKNASYDLKARNILISTLSSNVYYSISHHKSIQTLWNTLQVLYEGIEDIKDSKINMLTEEYELFHMEAREFLESMYTRFLHLINKLDNFGKSFSNKDYANKNIRSMCREYQPNVMAIK